MEIKLTGKAVTVGEMERLMKRFKEEGVSDDTVLNPPPTELTREKVSISSSFRKATEPTSSSKGLVIWVVKEDPIPSKTDHEDEDYPDEPEDV
jgi:hypothetical protein